MMQWRMCGLAVAAALTLGAAAQAEQIRFGDGGSIFGGATWTITPNDYVRFDAYQFEGALSAREGWVWDNSDAKAGHITFAIPGAFATAAEIARENLAGVGAAPDYRSSCQDAGSVIVEVAVEGLDYAASLDACAGTAEAPAEVRAYFDVLTSLQRDITEALGLDRLQN